MTKPRYRINVKSQITNSKSQINSKSQLPKFQTYKFWLLGSLSLAIVWNLALGAWGLSLYAQDKIVAIVNKDIITQKDLTDFINFARMQMLTEYKGEQLEAKIQAMK
jgi:hypothetical protein